MRNYGSFREGKGIEPNAHGDRQHCCCHHQRHNAQGRRHPAQEGVPEGSSTFALPRRQEQIQYLRPTSTPILVGGQAEAHQIRRYEGNATNPGSDRIGSVLPTRRGGSKIPPIPRGQTCQRGEMQTRNEGSISDNYGVSNISVYIV